MSARRRLRVPAGIPWPSVLFGALLGYLLSKARLTDYDSILNLFQLNKQGLPLWGTLGIALVLVAAAYWGMRLKGVRNRQGDRVKVEGPPFEWNRLPGGLLFGVGWALTGACPGTALAQLGEGKLSALFTILGVLLGTWLYLRFMEDSGPDCD